MMKGSRRLRQEPLGALFAFCVRRNYTESQGFRNFTALRSLWKFLDYLFFQSLHTSTPRVVRVGPEVPLCAPSNARAGRAPNEVDARRTRGRRRAPCAPTHH